MTTHDITSIGLLHRQLFKAMQLEHATAPPYISALYSIHPGDNADAAQILRAVAVEEMLHLTIAANVMNAVGGTVDFTVAGFVPSYPTVLPDGEHDFEVGLGPFGKDALETYLKIERPAMAPRGQARHVQIKGGARHFISHPHDQTLRYYSIGEFYAAIRDGIVYLESEAKAKGKTIFTGDRAKQATAEYYYSGGGRLWPVFDVDSACRAIDLVIEQGEGELKQIFGAEGEIAHYYRFDQLQKGRYYQIGDQPGQPTGREIHVNWEAVWPIAVNLKLNKIPEKSELHAAVADFNKAYREFLAFLTRAFNGEPKLLLEAVPRMFEFRNRMQQLIRNPLPGGDCNAAPTYEI
ncbi:MAG: ferritin-like protein [Nitrospira sp.]|nr:ferritin-like protein [Nitrospira sp.]